MDIKAGDILIAKTDTDKQCLDPGKEYLVYSSPYDTFLIVCEGALGDTYHYITSDWEKDFTKKETPGA